MNFAKENQFILLNELIYSPEVIEYLVVFARLFGDSY